MNPLLVTLRGPGQIDLSSLSNFEAGVVFLSLVDQLAPGIKFGELPALAASGRMAGFNLFRAVGNLVGDTASGVVSVGKGAAKGIYEGAGALKDGVGDVFKSTFTTAADASGDTVRLLTDEKVLDGISRIGSAYASQGGSEGVRKLFSGDSGQKVLDFFSALGDSFKSEGGAVATSSSSSWLPWALGGGAVLLTVMLVRR